MSEQNFLYAMLVLLFLLEMMGALFMWQTSEKIQQLQIDVIQIESIL